MKNSLLKPGIVACVAVLLTSIWVTVLLARASNDPLVFAATGTYFLDHDLAGTVGYDGQFAYYIALEGLAAQPKLDAPAYRFQRILYPLVVTLLSLGQTGLIPWMMILVNIVALAITVGWLAAWFMRYQRPPWYALIFALWIGVIFAVRLDLNEILCVMLGIVGLALVRDKRLVAAALLLALSSLAKDMGFVFVAAAGLDLFFSGHRRAAAGLTLFCVLPYVLWAGFVQVAVSQAGPINGGMVMPVVPLQGYAHAHSQLELMLMTLWLILPALVLGALAAFYLVCRSPSLPVWFVLVAAIWVVYLPAASAYDLIAAFRVGMPLIPAGLLFAAATERPRLLYVLSALWLPALLIALILPGFLT